MLIKQANHTLQEQRQERNDKHQEDADDTPVDPVVYRLEVVAPLGSKEDTVGVSTDWQLRQHGAEEDNCRTISNINLATKSVDLRVRMKVCTDRMTSMLLIWKPGCP
jgi:hypothetical protein